jgi:hypothetical protein
MADTMKLGSLAMRAVLLTIERGADAQRMAGNDFSRRADQAVAAGLARRARRTYEITAAGRAHLAKGRGSAAGPESHDPKVMNFGTDCTGRTGQ